jgi:hypothetical protein
MKNEAFEQRERVNSLGVSNLEALYESFTRPAPGETLEDFKNRLERNRKGLIKIAAAFNKG